MTFEMQNDDVLPEVIYFYDRLYPEGYDLLVLIKNKN